MKTKVMIIEDNLYKSFTTKQVLESQLKLNVAHVEVQTPQELASSVVSVNPDVIMCCPNGGVAELLLKMKKRHSNRRNTEITLVLAQDVTEELVRKFQSLLDNRRNVAAAAA